jgi:hypothetical protein
LSSLVCLGRRTVTGLLTAGGRQLEDWSADYRIFSESRFDCTRIFEVIREGVWEQLPGKAPIVVAMDDTILRKTGPKAYGVAWRRDPLSPPFHVNFVRGQRFIQLSAAVPDGDGSAQARMIPIDFRHAPTPAKPKKNAPERVWADYRRAQSKTRLGKIGAQCVKQLRLDMDKRLDDGKRPLWLVVDGSFTNREVIKNLPERTTLIGRIRKDAKLCFAPEKQPETGRRRLYGNDAPTPEQLRRDQSVSWDRVEVFAAGKVHQFKVKVMRNLRWRVAGADKKLMMIVIAPLAYRPRKASRLLYRQPGYLICTEYDLPVNKVLQAYVWRWDVEINFRDEKTLLGVGQAQVRNKNSVETVPALLVCAYSMLLLSAIKAYGTDNVPELLPRPKWRKYERPQRVSTNSLINLLRYQLWGKALSGSSFTDFDSDSPTETKYQKPNPQLASAVLYSVK